MIEKLNESKSGFLEKFEKISNEQELMKLKADYLGKSGEISTILKGLKDLSVEEKKEVGPVGQKIKEEINKLVASKLSLFEKEKIDEKLAKNKIDITHTEDITSGTHFRGGIHPVTKIRQEIEDIFLSMGFDILDGPHIEDEFHNFEALNIPADHPARDMQDTFWFHDTSVESGKRRLLRTHTSTVQVHGMLQKEAPFKFIAPGKVFRCERTDASHEMCFHQLEGMMVGEDVSVSHLIYFMKLILSKIFKKDVEVRLRPGFFPFVEPGFELDIRCLICNGKGCSVCKQVGWVELLPCGMVHPHVLEAGNIDSKKFNGFAFGLGLDRLVMMKYGIDDIRHLHSGDLRFVEQFANN